MGLDIETTKKDFLLNILTNIKGLLKACCFICLKFENKSFWSDWKEKSYTFYKKFVDIQLCFQNLSNWRLEVIIINLNWKKMH
jgi:hypothetical protein